jgi:hypothetical protein
VLAEQVVAGGLDPLQPLDVERDDQSAPQVAEFTLVVADVEIDLLDLGAGLLEGPDRLLNDRRDRRIDGIDPEVWAVGDAPAGDGPTGGSGESGRGVKGEGVAVVVPGQYVQSKGGVVDGPGERPLEEEGVEGAEGVGAGEVGHPAEGRLVAVEAAPRCGDPDRAAAVGTFRDG